MSGDMLGAVMLGIVMSLGCFAFLFMGFIFLGAGIGQEKADRICNEKGFDYATSAHLYKIAENESVYCDNRLPPKGVRVQ